MPDQRKYLTPQQVSERFSGKVSIRTLSNWRSQGNGPPFTKVGGTVMYPLDRLLEWENKNTVNSTSQYRG